MAANSRNYDVLTNDQRLVLKDFYDKGMNTTEKNMREVILKAAEQAGTSYEKVKKWIGNERRKRKLSERKAEDGDDESAMSDMNISVSKPPLKRMASGFNMFSSKLLASDVCKAIESKSEKMKFVSSQWQTLSDEERIGWRDKARATERLDPSMLSEKDRRKQIAQRKKSLIQEISYLESLGCELAVLMIDPETETVNQHGSNKGIQFLLQNETVALKFMDFCDSPKEESNHTRGEVQELFNRKYSDACGIPGSRVPYKKGNFTVTGLPNGIVFKKPLNYGSNQLDQIMKHQEDITFHLKPSVNNSDEDASSSIQEDISLDIYNKVLSKVVDETMVNEILAGKRLIEEKEVEVTDLQLNEQEFQFLTEKCLKYFTEDGWKSLKANYECACDHEGYILPVYTESKDLYWLFYFPGNISSLQGMQKETKIWGYWLDQTKEKLIYELILSTKTMSIDAINVIGGKTDEPLFLRRKVVLKNKSLFVLPESFHRRVIACLKEHGFA